MLDVLKFLKDFGSELIIKPLGWFSLGLFTLSLIPSLAFVPKGFLLFVLTH